MTERSPPVAEVSDGVPGAAAGVAEMLFDAGPVPTSLVAVTENVYAMPLVRPVSVQLSALVRQMRPPGFAVAVYDVTTDPPLDAGADQARATEPLPAVAELRVGAPGTVAGTADRAFEAGPVPMALLAVT